MNGAINKNNTMGNIKRRIQGIVNKKENAIGISGIIGNPCNKIVINPRVMQTTVYKIIKI